MSAFLEKVPKLKPGVRLRRDPQRGFVLMAPERVMVLDEIAHAIAVLIDGERSVAQIVASLARDYDAPEDAIAADVEALLRDLATKGYVAL